MTEELKVYSMLETVDKMLRDGEYGIVMLRNKITELEITDRLGKRLIVLDKSLSNRLGKAQAALAETKKQLGEAEKTHEALKRLRDDLVNNPVSVVD